MENGPVDLSRVLREKEAALAELKSARDELEHSNSFRIAVLDNVFAAILAYDEKGRRTYFNRIANEMFGPELVSTPADEWPDDAGLYDPTSNERVEFGDLPMTRALTGKVLTEVELVIRRVDGQQTLIHANARPMRNKDRELIGAVTTYRDITEERKAQEQLIQAQRLDALGQLTGGIAHDFNNFLSTMLGSLQLLERRVLEDERAKKYIDMCLRATKSGQGLTSRLLTFARRQKLEPSPIVVPELFSELKPLLRTSIEESIKLDMAVEEEGLVVFCDGAQLEAALVNLVINSRDAIGESRKGVITVRARELIVEPEQSDSSDTLKPGRYVEISVSDNGSGMSERVQRKALDPFFTTKGTDGTGLGLSMVYGFVSQSGGHVHIYSERSIGTAIKLFLPQAQADVIEIPAAKSQDEEEMPRGMGEMILVVEDEEDLREVAEGLLTDLGYRVIVARSGRVAVKILKSDTEIDLLFTDIVMPGGMTGIQLYDAALELRPDLPVLYTSGYAHSVVEEIETISDKLLSKPYVQATLAKMVRSAIEETL